MNDGTRREILFWIMLDEKLVFMALNHLVGWRSYKALSSFQNLWQDSDNDRNGEDGY